MSFLQKGVDFSVAKVTLELQMSVCLSVRLSVTKTPKHLRIISLMPIMYCAYQAILACFLKHSL